MNIITIGSTDTAWLRHVARFIYFARANVPGVKLHIALVYTGDGKAEAEKIASLWSNLAVVKCFKFKEMPGRLMYYDWLRSTLLDEFDLKEGLYADADIDILGDINYIPDMYRDTSDIIAPIEFVPMVDYRRVSGITEPKQIGYMYMYRSFADDFNKAYDNNINLLSDSKGISSWFVPGSVIWNIVMARAKAQPFKSFEHITLYTMPAVFDANAVHYPTSVRQFRFYASYTNTHPLTISFSQNQFDGNAMQLINSTIIKYGKEQNG